MLKYLTLLLFLIPATLLAQNTITGKVASMVNHKPVPDASVFLSNASVGGKSQDDGTFTLSNVKNGQYDLVVSCVGYETFHVTVLVNNADMHLSAMELMPKVTELKEVKIKYDANRDRYVRLFTEEFFGQSPNAAQCKLLNPELLDLDFDTKTGKLTASTSDFLIIENRALGYRIKYLLQSFIHEPRRGYLFYAGSSMFETLPGSSSQQKRWVKNRKDAYLGSDMHFLRSCIANLVPEEKFKVRRLIKTPNPERPADSLINAKIKYFQNNPKTNIGYLDSLGYWRAKSHLPQYTLTLVNAPLPMDNYIKVTDKKGIFALGYTDCLSIDYKYHNTTLCFLLPYSYFDNNGIILNPESNTMEGYWGTTRVAMMLPVDYELPAK